MKIKNLKVNKKILPLLVSGILLTSCSQEREVVPPEKCVVSYASGIDDFYLFPLMDADGNIANYITHYYPDSAIEEYKPAYFADYKTGDALYIGYYDDTLGATPILDYLVEYDQLKDKYLVEDFDSLLAQINANGAITQEDSEETINGKDFCAYDSNLSNYYLYTYTTSSQEEYYLIAEYEEAVLRDETRGYLREYRSGILLHKGLLDEMVPVEPLQDYIDLFAFYKYEYTYDDFDLLARSITKWKEDNKTLVK